MQNIDLGKNGLMSVVVPVFNEAEVLPEFNRRLTDVLGALPLDTEIIYVNDGSTDATKDVLEKLRQTSGCIGIVDLSRNFGKEVALTAGIDMARGDAVVVIDADLQDPPELIPELVRRWQEGFDVVYATRTKRHGETYIKRITAHAFYRFMQSIGQVKIPEDTGDFRLMSRRAVDALNQFRERHRFMKGLFALIGFPQISVPYERDARYAGGTKWNYWRLWNLAIEGITSFSTAPLHLATYVGLATAVGAFIYGAIMILRTLIFGNPVAGYPSLVVIILFLGGIQLAAIGVMGEYIGRIFNEVKQRPLYILKDYVAPEPRGPSPRSTLDAGEPGTRGARIDREEL
ncbi:MAG: glycosyltransferase family 2 protein [Pseudomonadota bacterium]